MNYCIIRFEKIKSSSELTQFTNHNFRFHIDKDSKERIDKARSPNNRVLLDKLNIKKGPDLNKNLLDFYAKKDIKPRKDSVLAIDVLATTSPEYWGDWKTHPEPDFNNKLDVWCEIQLKAVQDRFGVENVQLAVLHLDEETPHIHFLISTQDQALVTFKNRHGTTTKQKNILNAKRWDPDFYLSLVDSFAEANAVLGLERGKRGSEAHHSPLKDYKTELAKELKQTKLIRKTYINAIEQDTVKTRLITELNKENQALKRELSLLKTAKNIASHEITPTDLDNLGL